MTFYLQDFTEAAASKVRMSFSSSPPISPFFLAYTSSIFWLICPRCLLLLALIEAQSFQCDRYNQVWKNSFRLRDKWREKGWERGDRRAGNCDGKCERKMSRMIKKQKARQGRRRRRRGRKGEAETESTDSQTHVRLEGKSQPHKPGD